MFTRRLLTYLLIDTSGSMIGEPITSVNEGISSLLSSLRQNPSALETVHLSITTFDSQIKTVLPLTDIKDLNDQMLPEIQCPSSGATLLGEGLKAIAAQAKKELRRGSASAKGDWAPILIVLTDGKVTDLLEYQEAIPLIKACKFSKIIACAAGPKADPQQLKALTSTVVSLDTMDGKSFAAFFEWVSMSLESSSARAGASLNADMDDLPPPMPEINLVL